MGRQAAPTMVGPEGNVFTFVFGNRTDRRFLRERICGVRSAYVIPAGQGGVAVDIGANVGAFPITFGSRFDRVFCIEPVYENFQALLQNLRRYRVRNAFAFNLAAGAVSGAITAIRQHQTRASGNCSTLLSGADWQGDYDYHNVLSVSLEDLFPLLGIERINYLKVDCEGGEYELLMGKDLSRIDAIGIELHYQLGEERLRQLCEHIECRFAVHASRRNDRQMEITYVSRNMPAGVGDSGLGPSTGRSMDAAGPALQ